MKNCLMILAIVLALCLFFAIGVYLSGKHDVPTYIDIAINAEAWLDLNANGIREPDEPPLEGVCITVQTSILPIILPPTAELELCQYERSRTDAKGWWGTASNTTCHITVYAYVPKGYRATTPLVSDGCKNIQFGFVRIEP